MVKDGARNRMARFRKGFRSKLAEAKAMPDALDEREFYELMQAYRWAHDIVPAAEGLPTAADAFENVKAYVRQHSKPHLVAFGPIVTEGFSGRYGPFRIEEFPRTVKKRKRRSRG